LPNFSNDLVVEPCCLAKLECRSFYAVVIYGTGIRARERDCAVDNGLQYDLQIERGTDCATDLPKRREIAIARLYLLKKARVLDGYDRLVGESLGELYLAL